MNLSGCSGTDESKGIEKTTDNLDIKFLRRRVIWVSKIGYVEWET